MNEQKYEKLLEGMDLLMNGGQDALLAIVVEFRKKHPDTFLEILGLNTESTDLEAVQEMLINGEKVKATQQLAKIYDLTLEEAKEKVEEILAQL